MRMMDDGSGGMVQSCRRWCRDLGMTFERLAETARLTWMGETVVGRTMHGFVVAVVAVAVVVVVVVAVVDQSVDQSVQS